MSIAYKSTGFLIDEWITTQLKQEFIGHTEEIDKREAALVHEINERMNSNTKELINYWVGLLRHTLRECWTAQDDIMTYGKYILNGDYDHDYFERCARAAIKAQQKNKDRNILIRKIDTFLGEGDFTQLEKNY